MNHLLLDGIFDHHLEAIRACKGGCSGRSPKFSSHRRILTTKHVHTMIETQLRPIDQMTDTLRAAHD